MKALSFQMLFLQSGASCQDFGEKPDASSMEYIHAILEKIRARISAGEKN
jgi:hypothetical protein